MKPSEPKYLRDVIEASKEIEGLPIGVYSVEILHDDWCSIFAGGPCDCEPIVKSPRRAE